MHVPCRPSRPALLVCLVCLAGCTPRIPAVPEAARHQQASSPPALWQHQGRALLRHPRGTISAQAVLRQGGGGADGTADSTTLLLIEDSGILLLGARRHGDAKPTMSGPGDLPQRLAEPMALLLRALQPWPAAQDQRRDGSLRARAEGLHWAWGGDPLLPRAVWRGPWRVEFADWAAIRDELRPHRLLLSGPMGLRVELILHAHP